MPEIILDYEEIAEVTEIDSPEVQARLEKKGAVFAPAPLPTDEGGAASITSGVVTVNQLDLSMPYDVQPESWGAYTKIDVNVRKGPSSDFEIIKQLPKGKHVKLTHYTDKGEKVEGSEPERRWHFSPGRGGWIFDGGLHRWKKI